MDKHQIIEAIRRTTEKNGGTPLGTARFFQETGIKESDWFGKHWVRWSQAIEEAGFKPNTMQAAYDEAFLLEMLIGLIRELRHFPVKGDLILKSRRDHEFPSHNVFRRFGSKSQVAARLIAFCAERGDLPDVIAICEPIADCSEPEEVRENAEETPLGFVYLLRSGRYHKIGRSNAVGRRERELAIQLPEKVVRVHAISTDDPTGIEDYWHRRFASKRANGEWFVLSAADIKAFKRRKFM